MKKHRIASLGSEIEEAMIQRLVSEGLIVNSDKRRWSEQTLCGTATFHRVLSKSCPFAHRSPPDDDRCQIPKGTNRIGFTYRQPTARGSTVDASLCRGSRATSELARTLSTAWWSEAISARLNFDDSQAIKEALSLFLWDALLVAPRQIASKTGAVNRSPNVPDNY
jgi:hypothetical protein